VRLLRAAVCAALLLGLGACISLFPKTPPAQLYRFGADTAAMPTAANGAPFNVSRLTNGFALAAAGDRILTVDGDQAAYIAQARWEAPASTLFDEAEARAFDRSGGPARLLRSGDPANAQVELRLDVQTFEARYPGSEKVAPTVAVVVHALLVDIHDRRVLGDQTFESHIAAGDNRVGAIVQAFNAATADVLSQIVTWTGSKGAAGA
jgi:cholesterol transport system auxiliary component